VAVPAGVVDGLDLSSHNGAPLAQPRYANGAPFQVEEVEEAEEVEEVEEAEEVNDVAEVAFSIQNAAPLA